jgi:hypothetical protein
MPAPAGTKPGAPWGFLVMVIFVHFFDVLVRYGTTPIQIGNNPGSPWLWVLFFFLYGLVFIDASSLESIKQLGPKKLAVCGLIAYVWGPAWSIIPAYLPGIKYVAALMMFIAPFWLLVAFFATQAFPTPALLYTIFWFFLITFALFPNIQQYAEEKGYALPSSLNPSLVLTYSWEKITTGAKNAYNYFFKAGEMVQSEIERSIAMASGDYYTGQVDAAAQKRLGVYLENFRTSEPEFYENTPVNAYATIKAETIDRELEIITKCDAKGEADYINADMIRPQSTFTVLTSDQFDIDCIWNTGVLKKGSYSLRLMAEFPFSTRAYLKTYMIDRDRLKEYKKQGTDPLANIADKNPQTIYTSGPVNVGMALGQQPIALGSAGDTLPNLGVTISNVWEGKVMEITGAFFIIPEGLRISDIQGVGITEVKCSSLPEEEQQSCDDNLVNVYALTTIELALPYYKNLTTKTFRIPLQIINPEQILGKAPLAVQNFKVSVQYRYLLERTATATVKELPKATT